MVAWNALLKQSHKKLLQARLDTGREQWSHGARLSLRTSTTHPTHGFWKYSLTPGTWAGERKTPSAVTNQGAGLNWTVPKEEWWSRLVTFRGPRQSTINTLTQDHLISSFPNGSWRARLCSEHLYCMSTADVDTCVLFIVHSLSSIKAYVVLSHGKILMRRQFEILTYQQVMTQPSLQPPVLGLLTNK